MVLHCVVSTGFTCQAFLSPTSAPLPAHVQQAGACKVIGQVAANPTLAEELIEVTADMHACMREGGGGGGLGYLSRLLFFI